MQLHVLGTHFLALRHTSDLVLTTSPSTMPYVEELHPYIPCVRHWEPCGYLPELLPTVAPETRCMHLTRVILSANRGKCLIYQMNMLRRKSSNNRLLLWSSLSWSLSPVKVKPSCEKKEQTLHW